VEWVPEHHGTTVPSSSPRQMLHLPRLAHFAASPAVMPRCREMCGR
jgi:hypothetical protein